MGETQLSGCAPALMCSVHRPGDPQVLLGIDRVDYIKGIPHKLLAMETFLETHPSYVGKVVLLQIAVPTRTDVLDYQKLRATAHELVGRINGRFGSPGYAPVQYLDKSIDFAELVALYYTSAACVVSSLRDGMNLVAYEYVACQQVKCFRSWLPSHVTGSSERAPHLSCCTFALFGMTPIVVCLCIHHW